MMTTGQFRLQEKIHSYSGLSLNFSPLLLLLTIHYFSRSTLTSLAIPVG